VSDDRSRLLRQDAEDRGLGCRRRPAHRRPAAVAVRERA
jgi:hypothetical protein